MNIEVLIPTHHKSKDEVIDIVKKDNIQSNVLICNQTEDELDIHIDTIHLVNINNIGVSNNRNNLLDYASDDICVCIDDDCRLVDNYLEIVNKFFKEHPDAEYVLFNGIVRKENDRLIHSKKTSKVRFFNQISYGGGPGLVFKKSAINKYKLRYNTSVGYPNYIYMGEDTLFLHDLAKSKAIVYRSSEVLFSIEEDVDNSIYFTGVDERFLICKGYITSLIHPYLKNLYLFKYAYRLRHWRNNRFSFFELIKTMRRGFKYKNNKCV